MAYALDLLGERWTLLILRELFLGPRRFGDLHACLPGLGTNLLSKRLKELEEAGLIIGGAGDAGNRYQLADAGEDLRPTVRALLFWAIEYFMSRPEPSQPRECIFSNDLQPDSVALALEMFANKCMIENSNYILRLTIDDHAYTYYFMNNEMTARRGADAPAVATIRADVATLMQAMRGEIYLPEIRKRSEITGDEAAINHFLACIVPGAAIAEEVARKIAAASERA